MDKKRIKHLWLYIAIMVFFIFGYLLLYIPDWFVSKSINPINYKDNGQLGDLISGTTMPFIAFAGIILTFAAFYIQYRANLELKKDIDVGRIETKYYEFLKIHNENLRGINVDNKFFGSIAFEKMFYEFKYIFFVIANNYLTLKRDNLIEDYSRNEIVNIAYKLFFHGVTIESYSVMDYFFSQKDKVLSDDAIRFLDLKRGDYIDYTKTNNPEPYKDAYDCYDELYIYTFEYIPFKGYSSFLSQYYRHLFQTVKYIDKQNKEIIDSVSKYQYIKTIRAQLSNYEQLMLYYNSLSVFGWPWNKEENDYIQRYGLIRNIPLPLAKFGIDPEKMYCDIVDEKSGITESYFEWKTINAYDPKVIDERISKYNI